MDITIAVTGPVLELLPSVLSGCFGVENAAFAVLKVKYVVCVRHK